MQLDKIFISYSRVDSKFALRLAEDLQKAGLNIWIDRSGIRPSEPWDKEIEKALEDSDCILVILSPSSVSSGNVLNEINYAIEERKPVFPVIISSNIKKPLHIRRLQHIDFTDSYDLGFSQLLNALKREKQIIAKSPSSYKSARLITIVFIVFSIVVALIQLSISKNNAVNTPQVEKKEKEVIEKEYIIAGTVVDGSSNKSIELAEVSIVGRSEEYLTEGNGNFRIEFKQRDSSSSQFRIRVTKPGYTVYDREVSPPVLDLVVSLKKSN